MCEHGDTVPVEIRMGVIVDVDRCLAKLVINLNDAGFPTVASCCGHGNRPGTIALADGREILLLRDYEEARSIDTLWPDIHGNPPKIPTTNGPECCVCGKPCGNMSELCKPCLKSMEENTGGRDMRAVLIWCANRARHFAARLKRKGWRS